MLWSIALEGKEHGSRWAVGGFSSGMQLELRFARAGILNTCAKIQKKFCGLRIFLQLFSAVLSLLSLSLLSLRNFEVQKHSQHINNNIYYLYVVA